MAGKIARRKTVARKKPAAVGNARFPRTRIRKPRDGVRLQDRSVETRVLLNIPEQAEPFPLVPDDPHAVRALAIKWSYSLRNRERWAGRPDLLEKHREEVRRVASSCGLKDDVLSEIARHDIVEVSVPFVEEEQGWEWRILPWEYLLSASTRDIRGARGLTVVRHLRTDRRAPGMDRPSAWLQIESAPARLRGGFDFSSERELVRTAAQDAESGLLPILCDPDKAALERALRNLPPAAVVHFSGFDPHQGLQLLDSPGADEVFDGILVRSTNARFQASAGDRPSSALGSARVDVVSAWDVATMLGHAAPRLVACNVYNSAARTAAACVACGADAAIGFQDSFDDTLAELFFATFYNSWRLTEWNSAAAFRHAWQFLRSQQQPLHGSGLVLWSARSIRETLPGYWTDGLKLETGDIDGKWDEVLTQSRVALTGDNIREHVEIDVKPLSALNYSILHNDGAVFERFTIRKTSARVGRVQDLHVLVELHVGTDSYPYRATLELGERQMQTDQAQQIRVSLASALSRALRESVRTCLFVEILWGTTVLRRETFPITLLPVDEWVDTDENRIWLPSFVLPRDPAVLRTVERAQRYLMAIADDPSMGFSGYQSVDSSLSDSDSPAARCVQVDAQVRAIWSALLYDLPLSYINPPPVFSDYSQRLRTPSDVVDGKCGTCIDLALLLASCLEYVDIYPVLFLLNDHAFPGYWRDEKYYDDFVGALSNSRADLERNPNIKAGQRYSWYLERAHFGEILAEVHAGRLVPLETVGLTDHSGFAEAMQRGQGNLTSRRQFQAMLDIGSARRDDKSRVTPLPLLRT